MKNIIIKLLPFLFIAFNSSAQTEAKTQEITFKTRDSITISATFEIPKTESKSIPAIILIHQGGSSREEWKSLKLWNNLLAKGYAVLAYDIRIHGKSSKDKGDLYDLFNNPNRAPLDLLAAITFLENQKEIDSHRIGIIGASVGANLACVAAASKDYNIKSVVSISAKTEAVQNLSSSTKELKLKNAFHIASKKEQNGKRALWAHELFSKTTGSKKVEIASGDKHGSYILSEHEYLQQQILDWFKETI
ncbi:alpha/beta hydrolase [Lacinutrix jangbogonensis]|uniref:alpha/beta hydrolase n=1 Tax=Lacinutrix jangbogonensis TaxID=1469557 RepID=UPI00053E1EA7|nr:alpha/beta fold hydrolase [Lacinutrix jangbogonensis]